MKDITQAKGHIQPVEFEPIGIRSLDIPGRPHPVLAVLQRHGDLGRHEWKEVVMHDGNQWRAYAGSDTFQDGAGVLRWIYVDEVI